MPKILDQQSKLFGIINPIDLTILLILLVLAIQLCARYLPAPFALREEPVTIGLLARNAPVYLAEGIKPGEQLYDNKTGTLLGEITVKKVQPAEVLLTVGDKLVPVQSPRHVDLRLTVVRPGRVVVSRARQGVYLDRIVLRIGESRSVHSLYTALKLEVETLKVGK
jgi:hypothetical protein